MGGARWVLGLVLLAGVGCESPAQSEGTPATKPTATAKATATATTTAADSTGELTVKVLGKPFDVAAVYATSFGGEAIRLELAREAKGCAALQPAAVDADQRLVIIIAPQVQPDGAQRWEVAAARVPNRNIQNGVDASLTIAKADASRGVEGQIDLHHEEVAIGTSPSGKPQVGAKKPVLDISGPMRAQGCGTLPLREAPVAENRQADLEVKLAGKSCVIREAAVLERGKSRSLHLRSQPHGCDVVPDPEPADLHIAIALDGSEDNAQVGGHLLKLTTGAPIAALNLKEVGGDFTIDGSVTMDGPGAPITSPAGYPFTIRGKIVNPKICKH